MILTHEIWVRFLDWNPKCLSTWRKSLKAAHIPESSRIPHGGGFFRARGRARPSEGPHGPPRRAPHGAGKETNMADERDPEGEPGGQEPSGQTDWKAEARKWQKRAQGELREGEGLRRRPGEAEERAPEGP